MTLHEEQADREHANTAKSVADTYAVLAGTAPLVDHIRHERVRRGRRVMAIESQPFRFRRIGKSIPKPSSGGRSRRRRPSAMASRARA